VTAADHAKRAGELAEHSSHSIESRGDKFVRSDGDRVLYATLSQAHSLAAIALRSSDPREQA
jgi:hypothetical protein